MKKITSLIFVYLLVSNMYASTDSLSCLNDSNYCAEIGDSCIANETNELNIKTEEKIPLNNIKNKLNKTTSHLTKPAGWFSNLVDWVTDWVKPV